MTGLSDVPVIHTQKGSTRWLCLQSMLTTSAYLGAKNGGAKKRLGDQGAPRLLLAREPRSTLWLHDREFTPAITNQANPALPPQTDHGLFEVRRYGGPGQQNQRVLASILVSDIAMPFVVFPGFSPDQTYDLQNIHANVDEALFRVSGANSVDYRREPLRTAINAARGLPVVAPKTDRKKSKKTEPVPTLVSFVDLVRASEVEFDRDARTACRRICRNDSRYARLHEALMPLVYGPELPFLRDVFNASRSQPTFDLEPFHV